MTENHRAILNIIGEFLEKYPDQRFGQALFNLNILQFANPTNPSAEKHQLRDIHGDRDIVILERINTDL